MCEREKRSRRNYFGGVYVTEEGGRLGAIIGH